MKNYPMVRYSTEGLDKIRRANEARFIRDAHAKFGDRFDYSHVSYIRQKTPIIIVCRQHGEFSQTPDNHLQSEFCCPSCATDSRATKRKTAGEKRFLKKFHTKYGDRLELVSPYISVKDPIRCRCTVHNYEYETTPDCLNIVTHGCPICARESVGRQSRMSHEEFIERVVSKYGEQFDLSQAHYQTQAEKVVIGCPVHGEFMTRPADFLRSTHGCPKCGKLYVGYAENRIKKLEQGLIKARTTTLALMKVEVFGITAYKLGITGRSLIKRYREALCEILFETSLDELDALKVERRLHAKYFRWRDVRIFLAGLRSGKRWSGDSEIYKQECVQDILTDLRQAVSDLEIGDANYWERLPDLAPPILRIRSVRKDVGEFNLPKQVIRLDTQDVYHSATAAAMAVGSTQGLVSAVCNGKRGHTKGVRFAYLADYKVGKLPDFVSGIKGANHRFARAVRCLDTGEIYPTITAAGQAVGIDSNKIGMVCRGKRHKAGGRRWAYVFD